MWTMNKADQQCSIIYAGWAGDIGYQETDYTLPPIIPPLTAQRCGGCK